MRERESTHGGQQQHDNLRTLCSAYERLSIQLCGATVQVTVATLTLLLSPLSAPSLLLLLLYKPVTRRRKSLRAGRVAARAVPRPPSRRNLCDEKSPNSLKALLVHFLHVSLSISLPVSISLSLSSSCSCPSMALQLWPHLNVVHN